MQFLVDASLPRGAAHLLRSLGHIADDVRDVGFGTAPDTEIAKHAMRRRLILITADIDFADIRVYPPEDYFGIIVIDRPENASIKLVLELVRISGQDHELVAALPKHLAIVDANRIRVRPAMPERPE